MPEEIPIPERWKHLYNISKDSIPEVNANDKRTLSGIMTLIEELGVAEHKLNDLCEGEDAVWWRGEAARISEAGKSLLALSRESLAAAEQQIKLIQSNTTDLIAAAENRTHKAEEKLEALQWKRIETAPRDGTLILLARYKGVELVDMDEGLWEWVENSDWDGKPVWDWSTNSGRLENPTHWMNCLNPPAEPSQAEAS